MALANSTITKHLSLCSQDPARSTQPRVFISSCQLPDGVLAPEQVRGPGASWGWVWAVERSHQVSGNSPFPLRRIAYVKTASAASEATA